MLMHAYGCIDKKFMMDCKLYVENIIIHVLNMFSGNQGLIFRLCVRCFFFFLCVIAKI